MLRSLSGSVIPLLGAMILSVVCIYIRSIYRTIELLQGWDGYLITHESYFIGLDGAMMIVAVAVFNFVHPGWFLPDTKDGIVVKRDTSSADDFEMTHAADTR